MFQLLPTPGFTASHILAAAEAYNPHQMFHITQCENPPRPAILLLLPSSFFPFFLFFTSAHIGGNLIFHISFWFVDVTASGRRVHMQGADTLPLISPTATNCGRRTNERNSGRFHGSCSRRAEQPGAPASALSLAAGQALGINRPPLTATQGVILGQVDAVPGF